MRFSAIAAALFSAGVALGEVITVQVGVNNSLTYTPTKYASPRKTTYHRTLTDDLQRKRYRW